MDGLKRFEYATCGRVFFLKTVEKISLFQTKTDTTNANDFGNIKNYTEKGVNISTQLKSTF